MDRSAIFVDAGYLYAAGGELCCATRSRQRLQLDVRGVNDLLVEIAKQCCGLPVLRTYWYDAAPEGIPTPTQQAIASLPNLKLRLGRLNVRNQQKGVDALIYRDLMTLARERAVCEAFLLSGDEDLREGVRAAQDQGVRVTVVGIPPVSQDHNQSRELVSEADEVIQLRRDDLQKAFTKLPVAPRPIEASTTQSVDDLGRWFADEWLSKATEAEIASLKAQRPRIPNTLDVELFRFAEQSLGVSLRGQEEVRRQLRRSFWNTIGSDHPPAGRTPRVGGRHASGDR